MVHCNDNGVGVVGLRERWYWRVGEKACGEEILTGGFCRVGML